MFSNKIGLNFLKGTAGAINNGIVAGIGYHLKIGINQIKV